MCHRLLLQVFVPSPEGSWLLDANMLAHEGELQRAGIIHLMRVGDVAVGNEGNMGRMVWDGGYLLVNVVDLDYSWSCIGDTPPYFPALTFPPSYLHRIVHTASSRNLIVHIDIS
ncbi:hypothetical protein WOLCODRAFT_149488 [Wolfiporia cocos MD-104 SS10]|uniref:Uncharacterized protein n=1 Tax=Wolfiporia cocos (strain MD-104) TaxID=742152 RepID=A0A2H3JIG2_WOLCO|nr:hypothetical protein WOLCODRAFT_149488 [Wolfiporia cocos MD-104 SS10]